MSRTGFTLDERFVFEGVVTDLETLDLDGRLLVTYRDHLDGRVLPRLARTYEAVALSRYGPRFWVITEDTYHELKSPYTIEVDEAGELVVNAPDA